MSEHSEAAQKHLAHVKANVALAREGTRRLRTSVSDARWLLEAIRGPGSEGRQERRNGLREVAGLCEAGADAGRVVDRHLRSALDDVRAAREQTEPLQDVTTRQGEIDRMVMRGRLEKIEEDLGAVQPLVRESVVRLAGVADYLRQHQLEGTTGTAHSALAHRLSGASKSGVSIQEGLDSADGQTGRASGELDVACDVAKARMNTHRREDHSSVAGPASGVSR